MLGGRIFTFPGRFHQLIFDFVFFRSYHPCWSAFSTPIRCSLLLRYIFAFTLSLLFPVRNAWPGGYLVLSVCISNIFLLMSWKSISVMFIEVRKETQGKKVSHYSTFPFHFRPLHWKCLKGKFVDGTETQGERLNSENLLFLGWNFVTLLWILVCAFYLKMHVSVRGLENNPRIWAG